MRNCWVSRRHALNFTFAGIDKNVADAAADGRGHQTVKIDEEDAVYTYKAVGSPFAGWFSAKPLFDLIHKETNGDYLE